MSARIHPLVRPLEADWEPRLAEVARARGWPALEPDAVAELSRRYNDDQHPGRWTPALQAARLGFFFPRDVPKGAGAVAELIDAGLLRTPLKILDLGAGFGATTHGVVRALRAAGDHGPVEALLVDVDPLALDVARALAGGTPGLTMTTRTGDVHTPTPAVDLVIVGQTLVELPPDVDGHARWLGQLLKKVGPKGSVVVVEPALRAPTRHLHAVRDRLADRVFAPCLHAAACPMLAREADWCHEHLDVDLPDWLIPVARRAGLRYEGLTFSFVALRNDGARRQGRYRVVSGDLPGKGRRDLFLCGNFPDGPGRQKVGRLNRHAAEANAAWDEASRGDVLDFDLPGDRIAPHTVITKIR